MPSANPVEAIYYPHMTFQSPGWVKALLFYWETILRPVPRETEPKDAPEIRELIDAGLVKDFALPPFGLRALDTLGSRLEEFLRNRGGRLPSCVPAVESVHGLSSARVTKELEGFAKRFEEHGWPAAARAAREHAAQTLGLYATELNALIARERNLAPVTDDGAFDAFCTYFEQEQVTDEPQNLAGGGLAAAQLFVPTPSIEAVAALTVDQLVKIREKLAAQRRRFREKVQAKVGSIAELPSADAVHAHVKQLAAEVCSELEEARDCFKAAELEKGWTLLAASAPAALSAGVALAGGSVVAAGPLGAVASATLAVSNWFFKHRAPQSVPTGNYLLSAETTIERARATDLSAAIKGMFSR